MSSGNGGIIGVSNVVQNGCTASATASGVWALNTVYDYIKASDWVYNFAQLDYLVVAGGGSGGGNSGGGAGAGGLLTSFPGGTKIDIREGNVTDITVGAGGAAVCGSVNGNKGNDTVLASVTATGGGYGGNHSTAGGPGGSGGGGSGTGGPGAGTPGQGNAGGSGGGSSAGGGGGAGAVGTSAPGYPGGGGNGGAGASNTIAPAYPLGTTFGGGAGGHGQPGAGGNPGSGGGGSGVGYGGGGPVTAGTDGLGGGGGGGAPGGSRAGGDGVVFVRIATACKPASFAVAPGTNTIATVGSCTVATFTVTGTLEL